jgi:type I restriction enzyme S subunit
MPERPISRAGWTRVAFGDVVRLAKARVADPEAAGIERVVGLEHIEPGDLRIRRWGEVANGTTFTTLFKPGQVLFGKRRAYQRKVAVADFEGVCSGDIYVLEPTNDRLMPELLPFLCQTDAFFDHAVGTSAGSLSPRTNWTSLASFEFLLPPVHEQARLVEALSASATNLDRLHVLYEQAAVLLDALILETIEIRGFSMNHGYKGRFKVEKGERIYHARSGNGEPIPDDTGDTLFFKVADFNRNSDHRKLAHAEVKFSAKSNPGIRVFQPGTIVFPKRGASIFLNKIGILTRSAALDPNLMALEPRSEKVSAEYLMWFYKGIGLWRFADTTSVPQLNHKHLNPVPVPVPSVEQQRAISERISLLADASTNAADRLRNAQDAHTRIRECVFSEAGVSA